MCVLHVSSMVCRLWTGWVQWWRCTGWPSTQPLQTKRKADTMISWRESEFEEHGSFKFRRVNSWRHYELYMLYVNTNCVTSILSWCFNIFNFKTYVTNRRTQLAQHTLTIQAIHQHSERGWHARLTWCSARFEFNFVHTVSCNTAVICSCNRWSLNSVFTVIYGPAICAICAVCLWFTQAIHTHES